MCKLYVHVKGIKAFIIRFKRQNVHEFVAPIFAILHLKNIPLAVNNEQQLG